MPGELEESYYRRVAVTLLCISMKDSNSAHRVIQHLRQLMAAATPGTALPSVRTLMKHLGVSPATVLMAFAQLATEGMLDARPGRGTFVARPREVRSPSDP